MGKTRSRARSRRSKHACGRELQRSGRAGSGPARDRPRPENYRTIVRPVPSVGPRERAAPDLAQPARFAADVSSDFRTGTAGEFTVARIRFDPAKSGQGAFVVKDEISRIGVGTRAQFA